MNDDKFLARDVEVVFTPIVASLQLCPDVLVAARTRIEDAWAAYIGVVDPGNAYDYNEAVVLRRGTKLQKEYAEALFPQFKDLSYAN